MPTTDRYGRFVAVVYAGNEPVQTTQVKQGFAYPYAQYKDDCPIWSDILSSEAIARKNQLNLYSGNYERPWNYRRKNK